MFSDLVHYGALSCKLVLLSYWFSVTINNAYIAKYFFDLFHFFIGYTPVVANQLENSQLFGKIFKTGPENTAFVTCNKHVSPNSCQYQTKTLYFI